MKIWNFLLPGSGSHQLKVEDIGKSGQAVYIDGNLLAAPEGTTMFTGPSGSLMELRHRNNTWELHVNGLQVEEYSSGKRRSGDDTLRDLRTRPDGSYTIATSFSSDSVHLNKVRKFRFTAKGVMHEVEIGHQEWVWQIIHNGRILDRRTHTMWENSASCKFQVDVDDSPKLEVEVLMSWDHIKMIWYYTLQVNHISVPACWTKMLGEVPVPVPEVMGQCPVAVSAPAQSDLEVAQEPIREALAAPADLPQGVSYDAASGSFQANIRVHNRFVFLGEFHTAEQAHERYLQEADRIKQQGSR